MAKKMPTVGVDKLTLFPITETPDTMYETYGTAKPLPGVIEIGLSFEKNDENLWADDTIWLTDNSVSGGSVSVNVVDLTNPEQSLLLGQETDGGGGRIMGAEDLPPLFGLSFRSQKANGKYRYVAIYKTQFSAPDATFHTVEDSKTKQLPTIEGKISKRVKPLYNGKHIYAYFVDEDDPSVDPSIFTTWFTTLYEPSET